MWNSVEQWALNTAFAASSIPKCSAFILFHTGRGLRTPQRDPLPLDKALMIVYCWRVLCRIPFLNVPRKSAYNFMKLYLLTLILLVSSVTPTCDASCDTCNGLAVTPSAQCLTCISGQHRNINGNGSPAPGQCKCTAGFYETGAPICATCHYSCATCSAGNTATDCVTCDTGASSNRKTVSGGECKCANKFYDDGTNQACVPCHFSCATCSGGASTDCITCNTGSAHRNAMTGGECKCADKFYDDNSNEQCKPCHTSCGTCLVGGGSNECSTCNGAKFWNPVNSNICTCMTKYWNNNTDACDPCHTSCATCTTGREINMCDSCDAAKFWSPLNSNNTCTCVPKYYSDNTDICKSCHYSCATCSAGNTATDCVTCDTGASSNRKTVSGGECKCANKFYDDGTNQACVPCHFSCATCSGGASTDCITCNTGSAHRNAMTGGECKCADKFYDDGSNQACAPCHYSCATCSPSGSNDTCLTCDASRQLLDTSKCFCLDRSYDNNTQTCVPCLSSCKTCTNDHSCTSCDVAVDFRTMNSATQRCDCIKGYRDTGAASCIICDVTCLTCNGVSNTQCTSCNSTAYRHKSWGLPYSAGACSCITGFYAVDPTTQLCGTCHISCQGCTGPSSTECSSCNSAMNRISSTTSCICSDGFFENNTAACAPCPNSCLKCSSFDVCTDCPTPAATRVGTPVLGKCPCSTGYFESGVAVCSTCDIKCKTCTNNTSCSQCNSVDNRQMLNGNCICKQRFLEPATPSAVCSACSSICLTCNGTSTTECSTCNALSFRKISGTTCICMDKYFGDTVTELCSACDYKCQTCSSSAAQCSACNATKNRVTSATTCDCAAKFFDDLKNEDCAPCQYSCATCTVDTACSTCDTGMNRIATPNATTNLCDCSSPYYDNGSSQACVLCSNLCQTCSNSSTICLTCDATKFRVLNSSTCDCMFGYYDSGSPTCTQCSSTCATCSASGCTSCDLNANRQLKGFTCPCADGYYDNAGVCVSCNYKCKTCQGSATTCTDCPLNSLRSLALGVCNCPDKYFDNGTALCAKCHFSCKTCTIETECASCDSTKLRTLPASPGFCTCPSNSYSDQVNQQCVTCNRLCATCDATGCLTCDPSRTTNGSTCVCPDGKYDDLIHADCATCSSKCKTCTSATQCSTCEPSNFRSFDGSAKTCPCSLGYFDNNADMCVACDPTCLTCSGSATTCTSCSSTNNRTVGAGSTCPCVAGFFANPATNAACQACDKTCATCDISATSCTGCSAANFRAVTPTCDCISGYYSNGFPTCGKCQYSCLTCLSISQCDTCNADRTKPTPTSFCQCNPGKYDNGVSNACTSCPSTCLTCNNGVNCTTCDTVKNRALIIGKCECKQKFFNNATTECQACDVSCSTCSTTSTTCNSCNATAFRSLQPDNTCKCMTGYYADGTNELCIKCGYTCQSCTSASTCVCSASDFRIQDTASTCKCADGYFSDGVNSKCLPCQRSCKTCTNATECTSCDPTSAANRNATIAANKLCDCQAGYLDDGINQKCVTCPYQCGSCASSTQCATCNVSNFRAPSASGTACPCNTGYFDNGVALCVKCHSSCLTCTSASSCSTCNTTDRQLNGTCTCLKGFYDANPGAATSQCSPCLIECKTCTGPTTCVDCVTSNNRVLTSNRCPCSAGYYESNSAACSKCDSTCATCNAAGSCASCPPNQAMSSNNTCVCNNNYVMNTITNSCDSCHYSCLTCTGATSNLCTSCPSSSFRSLLAGSCVCDQYYYDAGVAVCGACQFNCTTCSNTVSCTSCDSSLNRLFVTSNSSCQCMNGYFQPASPGSNKQCLRCLPACNTCDVLAQCTTCNSSQFRSGTTCDCLVGYYDMGSGNLTCGKCHYSCLTCSSSSACLTCSAANFRSLTRASNYCLCQDKYYDDSTPICKPCRFDCFTCTGPNSCETCDLATNTRYLQSNGSCSCPSTHFENGATNPICGTCDITCLTCTTTATTCTSCNANNFRNLTATSCPCLKYYFHNNAAVCSKCDFSCDTCVSAALCATCSATKFRIKDSNNLYCACMTGYFSTGIETCSACSYKCLTCSTSATTCLTCPPSSNRDASNNCACLPTFFDSGVAVCSPCDRSCTTCTNGTACLTCTEPTRAMNSSSKLCPCLVGKYDAPTGLQCVSCDISCSTCTNATQCATCSPNNFRVYDSASKKCICLPGYISTGVQTCVQCPTTCATCASPTTCATCPMSSFRSLSGSNQCNCIQGYYNDNNKPTCLPCNYSCLTCVGPTTCDTCDITKNRQPLTLAQCPCATKFYDDLVTMNCHACHYSCATCTNSTGCSTCNNAKFRVQNGSSCSCKLGYFDVGVETCSQCDSRCVSCAVSATSCTSCDASKFRNITNNCACSEKYYEDASVVCQPCNYKCKTCTTSSSQCTTCDSTKQRVLSSNNCVCQAGYYDDLVNEDCIKCAPGCDVCSSSATCATCRPTDFRVPSGSQCVCLPRYYDNGVNQMCASCPYFCATCTNGSQCSTCTPSTQRILNLTNQICSCRSGFYDNGTSTEQCSTCEATCFTCTNASTCASCNSALGRISNKTVNILGASTNFCACQYGYYPVSMTTCSQCHYSCEVCQGPLSTDCNYCSATFNRTLTALVSPTVGKCSCNAGFYDDGFRECLACDSRCKTCIGPGFNNCTSCNDPFYYTANISQCNFSCALYQWADNTKTCQSCPANCPSCSNSTNCITCDALYYQFSSPDGIKCMAPCPNTYYNSNVAGVLTCKLCSLAIANCTSCSSATVCTVCAAPTLLKSTKDECYVCDPSCLICDGGKINNCLDCAYPKYLFYGTCISWPCQSNQYVNSLLGCVNCSVPFPYANSCNNTNPQSCLPLAYMINDTCHSCRNLPGYIVDATNTCKEICGDGNNFQMACDDGNILDGDGCSTTCGVEPGWKCTGNGYFSPSTCKLDTPLIVNLVSTKKTLGTNQIFLLFNLSLPVRLTAQNMSVILSNNALVSSKLTAHSLILYEFAIIYNTSVQDTKFSLSLNIPRQSRLLLEDFSINPRLLQGAPTSFTFSLSTYPPALYYSSSTNENFQRISTLLTVVCGITLALSVLGFLGIKKTVFYSIELFNLVVVIYVLEGLGMVGYVDWTTYTITGMKMFTLIGGWSLGTCDCAAKIQNIFGYYDQFFENTGIILALDAVVLLIMLTIYAAYKGKNVNEPENKTVTIEDKLWIFTKYYGLAILLVFNANAAFCSFLTLSNVNWNTSVALINVVLAILTVASSVVFFILLFVWTRQLAKPLIESQEQNTKGVEDTSSMKINPDGKNSHTENNERPVGQQNRGEEGLFDGSEKEEGKVANMQQPSTDKPLKIKLEPLAGQAEHEKPKTSRSKPSEYAHPKFYRALICDFQDLFNDKTLSSYYLFFYSLLVFLTMLFMGLLQNQPIIKFAVVVVLHIVFLVYVSVVKPFKSTWNNIKSIFVEAVVIGLMACDLVFVATGTYSYGVELGIIALICIGLIGNLGFYGGQVILAYLPEIQKLLQHSSKNPETIEASPKQEGKIEEDYDQKAEKVEMDAFFERIMKKNKLNKEERRSKEL